MTNRPAIEWRDEFRTGISSVDHEHQELIELINDAIRVMDSEGDRDLAIEKLGDVNAKVSAHFALEELIMRQASYSEYGAHKEQHEDLLDEIRDLMDAYEGGGYATQRAGFVTRLTSWFVTHFSTMDSKLHLAGYGH